MGSERLLAAVDTGGASTRRRSEADQRERSGLFPQTMSVMGNRWGFALLVAAFVGMSRFTDFQTQLGAPPGSIADRLSIFTANGVFDVSDNRYRLTEKGRALFRGAGDRAAVGAAVVRAPEGPAVILTHTACGGGSTRCWRAINVRGTAYAGRMIASQRKFGPKISSTLDRESANLAGAQ